MLMLVYVVGVICLLAIGVAVLIFPKPAQGKSLAERCPKYAARMCWREADHYAGEWACAACGCDSDEFGNKL
jgi:hypothetical protein